MFFLTRAAVCIGLVAAAASAAGGSDLAAPLDHQARDAVAQAGRACMASRECLDVGVGLMAAAASVGADAGAGARASRVMPAVVRPQPARHRHDAPAQGRPVAATRL